MTSGIIWYLILFPVQVAIIVSSVSFLQNQRSYRRELKRQAEEEDKVRLRRQIVVLEAEVNVPLDVLIRAAEEKAEREHRLAYVDRAREDFVYGLGSYAPKEAVAATRPANADCPDCEFEAIHVLELQDPIAWIQTRQCQMHATKFPSQQGTLRNTPRR